MIRPEIRELVQLGSFPPSAQVLPKVIAKQEELLRKIVPPLSDEEAEQMVGLFGPDDYFGGAWTVLHLIESAPGWPLKSCLESDSNEWIHRLKDRLARRR